MVMDQDEKIIDMLISDIRDIKEALISLNNKFDSHISATCTARHLALTEKIAKLETRIYLICGAITAVVYIAATLIGGWLGRG